MRTYVVTKDMDSLGREMVDRREHAPSLDND